MRCSIAAIGCLLAACAASPDAEPRRAASPDVGPRGASPDVVASAREASSLAIPPSAAPADTGAPRDERGFAALVGELSEPDGPFFSDNVVSNETSYVDVVAPLEQRARPGGAYVGVGPEQNFTYIAATRPSLAFIVDIRRQNLRLHLLYRAAFELASSRSHFLALLLGRTHDAASDPGPDASIEAILARATKEPQTDEAYAAAHAALLARVSEYGLALDAADHAGLDAAHLAFHAGQLATRFELKPANGRRYPTLGELLAARDPSGVARGFLAREASFRFVQQLEREGRVVPLVGDVAGDRALPGVARVLRERGLTARAIYISNVEQYLFEPPVAFARWSRNVAALPTDDESLFVRAYLDQGRRHPRERAGQRTATVLQRVADFEERQRTRPYASFYALATDALAATK